MRVFQIIVCLLFSFTAAAAEDSPRKITSLSGQWQFARASGEPGGVNPPEQEPLTHARGAGNAQWKIVRIPQAWQHHEGMEFHGVGVYRKTLDPIDLKEGRRLLLQFDAVATHATVYWNGAKLGEHLGPWTPFRFDVTEHVKKKPSEKQIIEVRVDERIGHNTQGFLPVIQPHFGGIWQEVKLIEVPGTYLDDLALQVSADAKTRTLHISVPVAGSKEGLEDILFTWRRVGAKYKPEGSASFFTADGQRFGQANVAPGVKIAKDGWCRIENGVLSVAFVVGGKAWSPETPERLRLSIQPTPDSHVGKSGLDETVQVDFAFRTIETKGDQFLLNGQPLSIRGVLNWGYYPPNLAPNPDPEVWRADLKLIKSWGFNLMKCCLWVPPKRLLEIADEEGVLIWMEYPAWHPQFTPEFLPALEREYREFFQHDRNHPSVILRSLTCETGHGADIKVIQKLYDTAKAMIPGCLVVDDSSWIEWNRVCDFYDDHPYGNNHTWVTTLGRLKGYIANSKLGAKPLILGEAIAADTWANPDEIERSRARSKRPGEAPLTSVRGSLGTTRPYYEPIFADANRAWLARMAKVIGGPVDQQRLTQDSLRYAMLMRKYQIEAYRKEAPSGGYVVSVMRDFPLAGMGLLGYDGMPKWQAKDWAWHGEKRREDDAWPKADARSLTPVKPASGISLVHQLDEKVLADLEAGGKVLLLPNGKPGSPPLETHWFLRGGPFVNTHHPLVKGAKGLHELFVEHQHFDLAGDVIPDLQYLEEIDPILMLWDNHDIPRVKTHGLVFETRIGKGRLLVSALNHSGAANAVGRWLIDVFVNHLAEGPPPRNALKPETITALRNKLREKKLDLAGQAWHFKPDGKNEGVAGGWATCVQDDSWKPIKIGAHWEGQGYQHLDGWAWYRLTLTAPKEWAGQPVYWHCDGVDDHAEFYVNGRKVGTMGNLASRRTAFEDQASFDISKHVKAGEKATLAVRVHDWQGAGGCHRPQWLSTAPRSQGAEILK